MTITAQISNFYKVNDIYLINLALLNKHAVSNFDAKYFLRKNKNEIKEIQKLIKTEQYDSEEIENFESIIFAFKEISKAKTKN